MNLAYKYPLIFWNCACLIADSGGAESEEDEESLDNIYYESINFQNNVTDFEEEIDDEDETEEEDKGAIKTTDKKKKRTNSYGKIL